MASELGGDMPCLRCKYNLKGLSIRSVCPECALPVKATLLAVVDPMASELRRLRSPWRTAAGVLAWSIAALGAALAVWAMWGLELVSGGEPRVHRVVGVLGVSVVVLTLVSGGGALSLIRPHEGIKAKDRRLALVASLAYLPLALVMWWMHVDMGPYGMSMEVAQDSAMGAARGELRVLASGLMMVIILGLRPDARLLAARSLLMRTGRVDRQTMLTLVAVLGLSMAGDTVALASHWVPQPVGDMLHLVGLIVVLVASVLFTLGLVGVVVDCWRMRPVIVESPVTLGGILGEAEPAGRTSPHTT